MSDTIQAAAIAATAATATPAAVTAPAAPVAAPAPAAADLEPAWLAGRLQREREATTKAILAELGVADAKDAKTALKAYRETEAAKQSEADRLRTKLAELEPLAPQVQAYRETLGTVAQGELARLTELQKAAVTRVAGDDPKKIIDTIAAFREAFQVQAAAAPAAVAAPPPANTAPPNAAPTPAPVGSPTNHKAVYEQMKQSDPMGAALYLQRHQRAIYPSNT